MLNSIEKLKGRDNYATWKFIVRAYLESEQLWSVIDGTSTIALIDSSTTLNTTEKAAAKTKLLQQDTIARSRIILLVDPINLSHIQTATTAKQVWDNLAKAFDDTGLSRRVGLLRILISTKLDECNSMEDYVDKIVMTAHKLKNAKFDISDEWIGTLLLAGLSEHYKPMIMAIESSNVDITSDFVKTKLLQDANGISEGEKAMFSKSQKSKPKSSVSAKCFECDKEGHFARDCSVRKKKLYKEKQQQQHHKSSASASYACFAAGAVKTNDWIVDTGATKHMTHNRNLVVNQRAASRDSVIVANSSSINVECMGNVQLHVDIDGSDLTADVKDVLCVPNLCANLLSVSQLVKDGKQVIFDNKCCIIRDKNGCIIGKANLCDDVYKLNLSKSRSFFVSSEEKQKLWHRRFGHIGDQYLNKLKNEIVDGVDIDKVIPAKCTVCIKGKQSRLPFKPSKSRATRVLELVHSDVCGPMPDDSFGGSRYFVQFLDDFSRKVFPYPIANKSCVFEKFMEFKAMAENETGQKIKVFRTDNGGEYCDGKFEKFLRENGIRHELTAPYTPEQNGMAERMNRTLVEKARCMLIDANLSKRHWGEAICAAAYIINRSPCSGSIDKTPEEIWSGRRPNVGNIRVFGCKAMMHIVKQKRKKFDAKSKECIMVGYAENSKAYRLLDPETNRIHISRDVIFLENEVIDCSPIESNHLYFFMPENKNEVKDMSNEAINDADENWLDNNGLNDGNESFISANSSVADDEHHDEDNETVDLTLDDSNNQSYEDPNDRTFVPTENVQIDENARRMTTRSASRSNDIALIANASDPKSVKEALAGPNASHWRKAMEAEIRSLDDNRTWTLTDLPNGRKAISSLWVFQTKYDSDGIISRFKARLVIAGCAQRKGIDYKETFSPVVRYSSIRVLLALAAKYDLEIHQMDAVSAFLHGDLDEEIYMAQPEMFSDGTSKVCRLHKSLYGLKQASRVWYTKLDGALKKFGLKRCVTDPCMYIMRKGDKILIVGVYVDDLGMASNDAALMNELKAYLRKLFNMKDLGAAKQLLGMRITRDQQAGTISIDQSQYIRDVLDKFNMLDCNPVSTPADINQRLTKDMCPSTDEEREKIRHIPYQEAVGSLLFAAQISRPDIQFAVGAVSRFNSNFGYAHWAAVKRIMRYLKGTLNHKLTYYRNFESNLEGFCDADWGGNETDRRSTTGYVFTMQGAPVAWNSKKQPTVAISTTESEYMAMGNATQEALWLRSLVRELAHKMDGPIPIHCDNRGAICLSENSVYQSRTKHIDIKHHFLREHVNSNIIKFLHIDTKLNVADFLTKPMNSDKQIFCCNELNLK